MTVPVTAEGRGRAVREEFRVTGACPPSAVSEIPACARLCDLSNRAFHWRKRTDLERHRTSVRSHVLRAESGSHRDLTAATFSDPTGTSPPAACYRGTRDRGARPPSLASPSRHAKAVILGAARGRTALARRAAASSVTCASPRENFDNAEASGASRFSRTPEESVVTSSGAPL